MSVQKRNKKDESATQITSQGYSFGFKLQVLAEVENGQLSINQAQAKKVVKQTIETYNQKRPHLSLGLKTPNQVHQNLMENPSDGNLKISKEGISLPLKKSNYLYKLNTKIYQLFLGL